MRRGVTSFGVVMRIARAKEKSAWLVRFATLIALGTVAACSFLTNFDDFSRGAAPSTTPDGSDEPDVAQPSSEAGEASSPDASTDGKPSGCDPSAPFDEVHVVMSSTAVNAFKVTLTGDELEAWVATSTGDDSNPRIMHTKRTGVDAIFGPLTLEDGIAVGADPLISADRLQLIYVQPSGPVGGFDLFRSTRTTTSASFGAGVLLSVVNSTADDVAPFLSSDGALWLASDRGDHFLPFRAPPDGNGGFTIPIPVPELTSQTGHESGIVLSADLLVAYVSSSRTDRATLGGIDIFRATRSSVSDPFGPPTNIVEVNSPSDDRASFISADQCRLYFDSSKSGLTIYVATKKPK